MLAGIGGLAIAAVALLKGLVESWRSLVTKKSENFLNRRNRLRQDQQFVCICEGLDTDEADPQNVPLVE